MLCGLFRAVKAYVFLDNCNGFLLPLRQLEGSSSASQDIVSTPYLGRCPGQCN
jgi:hypothetical protein